MNSLTSLTEYEHGMQHVECHDYENESEQYADDVMNTSEWLELSDAVDDDWMRLLAGLFLHVKNNNDSKHIRDKVIQCYGKIIHEHVTYGRNQKRRKTPEPIGAPGMLNVDIRCVASRLTV